MWLNSWLAKNGSTCKNCNSNLQVLQLLHACIRPPCSVNTQIFVSETLGGLYIYPDALAVVLQMEGVVSLAVMTLDDTIWTPVVLWASLLRSILLQRQLVS